MQKSSFQDLKIALQYFTLLIICFSYWKSHTSPFLQQCNLPPVQCIHLPSEQQPNNVVQVSVLAYTFDIAPISSQADHIWWIQTEDLDRQKQKKESILFQAKHKPSQTPKRKCKIEFRFYVYIYPPVTTHCTSAVYNTNVMSKNWRTFWSQPHRQLEKLRKRDFPDTKWGTWRRNIFRLKTCVPHSVSGKSFSQFFSS